MSVHPAHRPSGLIIDGKAERVHLPRLHPTDEPAGYVFFLYLGIVVIQVEFRTQPAVGRIIEGVAQAELVVLHFLIHNNVRQRRAGRSPVVGLLPVVIEHLGLKPERVEVL